MKVIQFDKENKDAERATARKEEIKRVLDEIYRQVEAGEIEEFTAASMRNDGTLQLHAACYDITTAVGMFELAKQMIILDHYE